MAESWDGPHWMLAEIARRKAEEEKWLAHDWLLEAFHEAGIWLPDEERPNVTQTKTWIALNNRNFGW